MSFIIITLFVCAIILIYARYKEKTSWNNGICPVCKKPWTMYDIDSQGGRMYHCENGHYCDISYRVDK